MKKIYYILLLTVLYNIKLQAQLTLTKAANEPVVGDVYSSKKFDTVSVFPKNTGTGQSWNFSNMAATNSTDIATYVSVASTPSPALFPNATIVENKGGNEFNFYKSTANTFDYSGLIFSSGGYATFSDLGTLYSWPISYGSTNTDAMVATEISGTNTINWTGTVSYTAAGTGTVTMPGGGVYTNCLMIKTVVNITMAASTFTNQMNLINYEYWSQGLKFPLLVAEYQTNTAGSVVSKEVNFNLNLSAVPLGIYENDAWIDQVNVFPNPATTDMTITLSKSLQNYSVILTDLTGKKIVEGANLKKIDVSMIEKGIYIMHVSGDNFNARKTIAITH